MRDLRELFPEDDFGFRLTLRRGSPAEFFAPTSDSVDVLTERRKWLEKSPQDYSVLTDAGRDAWAEFSAAATAWTGQSISSDPVVAGAQLEPDVVLLCRDGAGHFRVAGGVVVFPSHWSLREKIGLTLLEVHGVVPGLNTAIGPAIDRYLDRLKPGFAAGRPNWGLAATNAMNLHPAIKPPPLIAGMPPEDIWLRIEEQNLSPLPESGGILFGIRIERVRLSEALQDPEVRRRFYHTVATMPAEVAAYKGMSDVLPDLLRISS